MGNPPPTDVTATAPRKRDREKTLFQLNLALHRLEKRQEKITIAAVAKEAEVTTALIHNRYPDFAETIRKLSGKATREQRDAKHEQLVLEREKNSRLREELATAMSEMVSLASINESLRQELALAKAIADGKITRLKKGGE